MKCLILFPGKIIMMIKNIYISIWRLLKKFTQMVPMCSYVSYCKCAVLFRITKTHLYNFDPLKPHFYIVKLGFTGVYIIFLIFAHKHRLWVLVRTALESKNMKNNRIFLSENFHFLAIKCSIYLNGHVFVMVIACAWSRLLRVPREYCASWLCPFLGNFHLSFAGCTWNNTR